MKYTSRKRIDGPAGRATTVVIEPYGDVLALPVGDSLDIVAQSDQPGEIEIVTDDPAGIAIYTWPGSTCAVYQDDKLLRNYPIPVPGVPKGSTTRGFVS